jgi:bifunctional non-homologous end joining protein LigD
MKKGATSNLSFEQMMALRVRDLPVGNWLYELKFDGYRALAFKAGKEVRLLSRNRTIFNEDYPQLIDALKTSSAENVIIDGEITALDQNGRSSFQLLQSFAIRKQAPLIYDAFDLLSLEGTDLRSRTLYRTTQGAGEAAEESLGQCSVLQGTSGNKRKASPTGAAVR